MKRPRLRFHPGPQGDPMIWYDPRNDMRRCAPRPARHVQFNTHSLVFPRVAIGEEERTNSTAGTISFLLAVLLVGLEMALLGLLALSSPTGGSAKIKIYITLLMRINIYLLFTSFLGVVLSIIGITEPGCKRALSAWGAFLNGVLCFGLLTAFVANWR
jgi:hypothetical protein